jgi:hypothetical protein
VKPLVWLARKRNNAAVTPHRVAFVLLAFVAAAPASSQPAALPAKVPLDSSQPLPAQLQPQVNELLGYFDAEILPSNPQEQKLKACWLETLRAADGDDRIIPWTRICPHSGASGVICEVTSAGETKLAELIRSEADVPGASDKLERKFIVHLKSDLIVKRSHLPPEKNSEPDYAIYVAHLAAMREDALLAIRNLPSAEGPAYQAIRKWIDARKSDPKSFYRCLALES